MLRNIKLKNKATIDTYEFILADLKNICVFCSIKLRDQSFET